MDRPPWRPVTARLVVSVAGVAASPHRSDALGQKVAAAAHGGQIAGDVEWTGWAQRRRMERAGLKVNPFRPALPAGC